ncbi:hypothetical protein T05_8178, partial [Trichinella murrelli]
MWLCTFHQFRHNKSPNNWTNFKLHAIINDVTRNIIFQQQLLRNTKQQRQICKFTVDVVLGLCFGSNPEFKL